MALEKSDEAYMFSSGFRSWEFKSSFPARPGLGKCQYIAPA
jgi:hypothetical protein